MRYDVRAYSCEEGGLKRRHHRLHHSDHTHRCANEQRAVPRDSVKPHQLLCVPRSLRVILPFVPSRSNRSRSVAKPKRREHTKEQPKQPDTLTGWQSIASFLRQPINVALRWAKSGMPVKRQGKHFVATPDELNAWLGRETGEPVHVATTETDLSGELKRGLAYVRKERRRR